MNLTFSPVDTSTIQKKKVIEKFRECHNHNHNPQPTSDTKRKRKRTKTNAKNKQTHANAREAHRPVPSSPSEVITMLNGIKKIKNKEHGKTLKHEVPLV